MPIANRNINHASRNVLAGSKNTYAYITEIAPTYPFPKANIAIEKVGIIVAVIPP